MDNFSWANCRNIGLIESGCKIGAAGKLKSFSVQQFFKNAAEVWASSPHLRSKLILQSVFPVAIAFFETCQFGISCFYETKLQIQTRQRGNCSTLVGKSRGGTPFCRTLKIIFSKSRSCIVSCKTLLLGKPPESGSARLGHIPSLPGNRNCS